MGIPTSLVIYIGNEPMLSKASAALLRRAGFKVRMAGPLQAPRAIASEDFAAVILCATLSSVEAESVVEAVQQKRPGMPIVSVHLGLLGDQPNPASSVLVDALKGPDALVEAVQFVAEQKRTALRAG